LGVVGLQGQRVWGGFYPLVWVSGVEPLTALLICPYRVDASSMLEISSEPCLPIRWSSSRLWFLFGASLDLFSRGLLCAATLLMRLEEPSSLGVGSSRVVASVARI